MERIDFNDEEAVSVEEFVLCLLEITKEKSAIKEAAKAFEKLATEDQPELVTIAALIDGDGGGEPPDASTRTKLEAYLSQYDGGGKGSLTFEEFYEMNRSERMKHKVGHGQDASNIDLTEDVKFTPDYKR